VLQGGDESDGGGGAVVGAVDQVVAGLGVVGGAVGGGLGQGGGLHGGGAGKVGGWEKVRDFSGEGGDASRRGPRGAIREISAC